MGGARAGRDGRSRRASRSGGRRRLVDEGVGDGVVVAVELDVVVDVDAGVDLPLAVDEGLGAMRQGAMSKP